jgi:hypothetical protein
MSALGHSIILRAGRFDQENGSTAPSFNDFISKLQASPPKHIVIYFHGGLVDLASGIARASTLAPKFQASGATPIFVIWESGWHEVIEQNLPTIFNEGIFKRILRKVTQSFKGKIDKTQGTARGLGDLPLPPESEIQVELTKAQSGQPMFGGGVPRDIPELTQAEEQEILRVVQRDTQLRTFASEIANSRTGPSAATSRSVTARGSTETLMTPEVLDEIAPVQQGARTGVVELLLLGKHVVAVVAGVISRFRHHRDHGPYLTIVEEILREFYVRNAGKFLWDGMKKEIDQAFDLASDCGGKALIDGVRDLWLKGVRPKMTIIGHSAGAIYAARVINEIEKAELPADMKVDLVLIAPACTFKVFREMLQGAANRIAGLRVFGLGDERERQNALVPIIYPSSLLYFVSGVIEDERDMPLLGMQRYYGGGYEGDGFEDLAYVRMFQQLTLPHAYAWAETTGYDGWNCDMASHGGWTEAPQTLASVLYVIKNGLRDG